MAEAAITIKARDVASSAFKKVGQEAGFLGGKLRTLLAIVRRATLGFIAFNAAIIAIPALLAAFVTATTAVGILSFERSMRRARLQLQLMGLSSLDARQQMAALGAAVDRTSAVSIMGSVQAMEAWQLGGWQLGLQLAEMAEQFAKMAQVPVDQMFAALISARVLKDFDLFNTLTGSTVTSWRELMVIWDEAKKKIPLDAVSALADSLDRLSKLSVPTKEAITVFTATFLDIFISSLVEHLETAKDAMKTALLVGLSTVFFTAGRGLAFRFVAGFGAGLLFLLIVDMKMVLEAAFSDPLLLALIGGIAFALGKATGSWLVAGIFFTLSLQLFPGMKDAFDRLSTPEKTELIVAAAAAALGLAMKVGFMRAFVIFTIVKEIFGAEHMEQVIAELETIFSDLGKAAEAAFRGAFWTGFLALLEAMRRAIALTLPEWLGRRIVAAAPIPQTLEERTRGMLPHFQLGGIIPGAPGQPVPIMAHGGEFVVPRGGAMPIVIQLFVDKKQIQEWSLDAWNRTARLKATLVPGSLGS